MQKNYCLPIYLDTNKRELNNALHRMQPFVLQCMYTQQVLKETTTILMFLRFILLLEVLKDFGLILCDLFLQCNTHTLRKQYWQ